MSEQKPYLSQIQVEGAREHNLKNVDVSIPHKSLTVITGLSGSGKSSLAFDTLYAEGQRRYMETLSVYARQFMGDMERPDVDRITGLSPVIAIEQKTVSKNPRSTVGTITEIYDFLRLLFARASIAYSMNTGEPMVRYSDSQILERMAEAFSGRPVWILAPLVQGRKGHYKELFEQVRKKGFLYVRVDGEIKELVHGMRIDRYKNHFIEIVIDKFGMDQVDEKRLRDSLQTAMRMGKGTIMVVDKEEETVRYYSRHLMCPTTGLSYNEPAPHNFSFNSPQGACPVCNGLGTISRVDRDKMIPNPALSIRKGGLLPLGPYKSSFIFSQIEAVARKFQADIDTPLGEFPEEALSAILYGTEESFRVKSGAGGSEMRFLGFEGVVNFITQQHTETTSKKAQKWAEQFLSRKVCPECGGTRLRKESLFFRVHNCNIAELAAMDIRTLRRWFGEVEPHLSPRQWEIASEIVKEIQTRLDFLLGVGLDYLSLNLSSSTLSGGESQRIRLATQIGSQLVNVLYILDEPSIGLHQRDNHRLIDSLKQLRDSGNTVLVVEHDRDMILSADYVIDMGPLAGRKGGKVVAQGTPSEILFSGSLTAQYLNGEKEISLPAGRRKGNGRFLTIRGASGNNLKDIDVSFPLGTLICVTGVSGSGKSTLINDTLQPALSQYFYRSVRDPLPHKAIEGIEQIDKIIQVDQSPLGRTPRSNPATYTGVFTEIRNLYANIPESKVRAYGPGRFSFNVKGGRCETCQGAGVKTIEMNFLPDVYVECPDCGGKRYNRETLEVRYKGKNIGEVLDMTINMAVEFFGQMPSIYPVLKSLQDVGLGYVRLGQPCTTLSGGESQRVKLATELSKRDTGNTLYVLDEPTTGLHFEDIRVLLDVLQRLVDRGNTVLVIEHNLDVIKTADYIIDLGPEGGSGGGKLLCAGTPEQIATCPESHTAPFLRETLPTL